MKLNRQLLADLLGDDAVRSISRRYFVSNGFDGTLTSIGIVVGALLSGVTDGTTVVRIGLGAAVGLGTSGVWSVWEIERAEKRVERLDIERAMLVDLGETRVQRRVAGERLVHAVASGLGPVIGVLVPLAPFVLVGQLLTVYQATVGGVLLGSGVLFVFGAYLGSVSEQNWLVAGLRMGVVGVVVALLNLVLP